MGLALVYPPSLKVVATWFRRERGLALGVMIGALTLGSALPHLLNAVSVFPWRGLILATSALTLLGGAVAEWAGRDGPFPFPGAPFEPREVVRALRNPGVRLASLGYFGHMWELYAMWSWSAAFYADVFRQPGWGDSGRSGSLAAFAVIGAGSLGCVVAGRWADGWGRARMARTAMALSGACALAVGWTESLPVLAFGLGLVWGFWVVADSAQFSALVTEAADQQYVGTALTTQLAIGFTLTVLTIWLVPLVRDAAGWGPALALLAPGPALGVAAMRHYRTGRGGTEGAGAKPNAKRP
jgi:MFS family permease